MNSLRPVLQKAKSPSHEELTQSFASKTLLTTQPLLNQLREPRLDENAIAGSAARLILQKLGSVRASRVGQDIPGIDGSIEDEQFESLLDLEEPEMQRTLSV